MKKLWKQIGHEKQPYDSQNRNYKSQRQLLVPQLKKSSKRENQDLEKKLQSYSFSDMNLLSKNQLPEIIETSQQLASSTSPLNSVMQGNESQDYWQEEQSQKHINFYTCCEFHCRNMEQKIFERMKKLQQKLSKVQNQFEGLKGKMSTNKIRYNTLVEMMSEKFQLEIKKFVSEKNQKQKQKFEQTNIMIRNLKQINSELHKRINQMQNIGDEKNLSIIVGSQNKMKEAQKYINEIYKVKSKNEEYLTQIQILKYQNQQLHIQNQNFQEKQKRLIQMNNNNTISENQDNFFIKNHELKKKISTLSRQMDKTSFAKYQNMKRMANFYSNDDQNYENMRFSSNSDKSGNPILSSVGSDSTIKKGRFSCYISRKNDKKLFSQSNKLDQNISLEQKLKSIRNQIDKQLTHFKSG